ncbi:hypothetical protein GBAG_3330 [Buttiauxella agrestis ATCC 33320]|uniref:Uncharacterized protein n=1 Tax=Buttiauxella agrestis ATCC 33320 TaxID=1006004 RepID=A0A085G4A9_9ENTR|nr:hypothetical protein GBAG_3330 [Buttiauxella agrestis ATCC 33320]
MHSLNGDNIHNTFIRLMDQAGKMAGNRDRNIKFENYLSKVETSFHL